MNKLFSILTISLIAVIAVVFLVLRTGNQFFTSGKQTALNEKEKIDLHNNIEIVAQNLKIPWDIAFLPGGDMLVTERGGKLLLLGRNGSVKKELLSGIGTPTGEGGLLGVAVDPGFSSKGWIYIYFSEKNSAGQIKNSVRRYWFQDDKLMMPATVLSDIPGSSNHDGGRIEFGPDGMLYITTGDAGSPRLAQDINSLAGKIIRIKPNGEIPPDNPFGNAVWSYGHRNPQGIAWDKKERLWSTEHGPSALIWPNCCQDEINLIEKGKNYGWPDSFGDRVKAGTVAPVLHSGRDTWAPASAAIFGNSLFFGGLRGEALYEAVLNGDRVTELKTHLKGVFGRIRTIRVGPDGYFYLTTSNTDGRGKPKTADDKIIRLNPRNI